MSYYSDPYSRKGRNINEGFRVGLIGGIFASLLHLLLPFFSQGDAWGEVLAWVLQWFLYLAVARSAAQRQYDKQQMELDPLNGVQGAGTGAALVTSILTWIFILLRGLVVKALGDFVIAEPFSLYCIIVIDVSVAIALGTWSGSSVAKKYRY